MTTKQHTRAAGHDIAYVDAGDGRPIVLLHGNPTSSYLWRHVIPVLALHGRCLAPDLLGMGDSAKIPNSGPDTYRFVDHQRWFDAWMTAVGADDDVTVVAHDWGSALAFDWARRHPRSVRAIAYMEAIVAPISRADLPADVARLFDALRSPAGDELVLEHNVFIERILASTLDSEDNAILAEYRRPFIHPGEARRPMLAWAREVPLDGTPSDVHDIVVAYSSWLETDTTPKLFVNAEPGAALVGAARERCRRWPNQQEVTVTAGHFVPEDAGTDLGRLLAQWWTTLETTRISEEVA